MYRLLVRSWKCLIKTSKIRYMKNFKLGCSPLTGTIYAGTVTKAGLWSKDRQDVTDSAPGAVAEYLLQQGIEIEFDISGQKYVLKLDKVH